MKSVHIWSYSGPHFPAFGLSTERQGVSLRIQYECGKTRITIIPKTNIFNAVITIKIIEKLEIKISKKRVLLSKAFESNFERLFVKLIIDS